MISEGSCDTEDWSNNNYYYYLLHLYNTFLGTQSALHSTEGISSSTTSVQHPPGWWKLSFTVSGINYILKYITIQKVILLIFHNITVLLYNKNKKILPTQIFLKSILSNT